MCWTYCFTLSAFNTFGTIDFLRYINTHGTSLSALIAAYTLILVNGDAAKTKTIKQTVKCAQRTKIFTKSSVDKNTKRKDCDQNHAFPTKQKANNRLQGFVAKHKRNAALQNADRTEELAKIGRRHSIFIGKDQRQYNR